MMSQESVVGYSGVSRFSLTLKDSIFLHANEVCEVLFLFSATGLNSLSVEYKVGVLVITVLKACLQ